MPGLAAITRNISWNYLNAGLTFVTYLLLTPLVVRSLGTTGYGLWILANTLFFYLKFLDLGFYTALVKFSAEHAEREEPHVVSELLGTSITALLIAGAAALALSGAVATLVIPNFFDIPPDYVPEMQEAMLIFGGALLIGFPASALSALFEGYQRFDLLNGIDIASTLFSAAATAAVLLMGHGIIALAWIYLIATAIDLLLSLLCLRRLDPGLRVGFGALGGANWRRLRSYSTWTSFNEILAEGGPELEKLLIPIFLSVSLLTPYSLICTVAAVIFLAIDPITDVFFPLSSAYDAGGDKGRLRTLLLRGTKAVMAISLPLAVAVGAYGAAFIELWIGDGTVEIPEAVMRVVVISFSISAFIVTGATVLLALGRVREVFWLSIAELALACVLIVIAGPAYGLFGFAVSLLIANFLLTFFGFLPLLLRHVEQPLAAFLKAGLLRPLLAALPMALTIAAMDRLLPGDALLLLLIKSGLGGLVYLIAFYLVTLTGDERRLCLAELKRLRTRTETSA